MIQQLVRALAEDKADIHLDPVLYRACAMDLKGVCKDVPRGSGRRKSQLLSLSISYVHVMGSLHCYSHALSCSVKVEFNTKLNVEVNVFHQL